jgi:hypothetical protein
VIITPREIYDAVVRVSAQVNLLSQQVVDFETDTADHERRLRALEGRPRWPLASVTALAAVMAVAVSIIALLLRTG